MFTGNENHYISLQDAADLTERYRNSQSGSYIKGQYFGGTTISSILSQQYCVGIRIYYGLSAYNVPQLVIVGVDSAGNDLINGLIADHGVLCPSVCSTTNALNS